MGKGVESIKINSTINIEVGGGLYVRLHNILLKKAEEKKPEEYAAVLERLRKEHSWDEYSFFVETMLSLLYEIETKARAQDKIEIVDYEQTGSQS